ncbi:DNA (cytosine-5-)-methyltransferase [Peribacillus tepidiphilus]|uniref:DNA (cytosine-5-)-methyltransferase n=1 Tax=Peribacillus tepidiphilus TaxID=2652445 RepID=UPI001CDBF5D1|nr:DNA (cytosine-5-)-methyltransferase [Peribacillus tepidiphilus]
MLSQNKSIDNLTRKELINDLKDIMTILNFHYEQNNAQLSFEHLYSYVIDRIGLLTKNDLEEIKKLFKKIPNFSYEDFVKQIEYLSQDVCKTDEPNCEQCPINNYCSYFREVKVSEYKEYDGPLLIDLFCGAGGMSLGFKQEGFKIVLANDIEKSCIDTYVHNHPEIPRDKIIHGDIQDLVSTLDSDLIGNQKVDVVIGGPPCQGFSNANRQRLIDDPRNKLYKYYVEFVGKVKPKFFVMENVRGMYSIAEQVVEDFNSIGYEVHFEILNAVDFGVPQNRERLIFIGNNIGVDNKKIFEEIHASNQYKDKTVLKDALYGLRELEALRIKNATEEDTEESGRKIDRNPYFNRENAYTNIINEGRKIKLVFNHKARYNNDRDIEIFGRLYQGDKSDDPKIADIMPYKNRNHIFKDKYFKLENDKPCKTITAHMKFDCNMYIHPTQARGLTPREAARVQSYPDDYYFKGPYTKTYMQIGNSVPPLMSRGIAQILKNYVKVKSNELQFTT